VLIISESIGDMIALEHLNKLVGEEYKPYDLLFGIDNISKLISSGKTG
jgi:ribosomal protein L7Ae-like RNA K-turn-binding protein